MKAVDDGTLVSRVSGKDRRNLAMLEMPGDRFFPDSMIDVKKGTLIKRPELALTASSQSLTGDGKDKAEIAIEVRDASGAVETGFAGAVKITTSHGKLSAPRGIVQVKGGKGAITLTATNETIDRVFLTATSEGAPCTPASLALSFA
jgi:hypothetical protein